MRHHVGKFIKWECCSQILGIRPKLFPNAKEITESVGAYSGVTNHIVTPLGLKLNDTNIAVVCPGDGVVPRTAATFAFRSKWSCFSIDPNMKKLDWPIERLTCERRRIEEKVLDLSNFEHVIICMVHSHANLKRTLENIRGKRVHLLVMECCVLQDLNDVPYIGYKDTGIWSPKNEVKIWLDLNEKRTK